MNPTLVCILIVLTAYYKKKSKNLKIFYLITLREHAIYINQKNIFGRYICANACHLLQFILVNINFLETAFKL